MVSPDILGVSSGASVGASLGLFLNWSTLTVHLAAFILGLIAVTLVVTIAKAVSRGGYASLLVLILAGLVVSSLFSAFDALIKYMADPQQKLQEIMLWLMGSFSKAGNYRNITIMLGTVIAGITPFMVLRWKMNVLSFGEEEARALGLNVKRLRLIIIVCSTFLTASAVCLCGNIGWVGLIIPHAARFIVGPNYRILLPTAMLTGGLFMALVDNFARVIIPGELPLSILTSFIGAPFFIYLLLRHRKEWV